MIRLRKCCITNLHMRLVSLTSSLIGSNDKIVHVTNQKVYSFDVEKYDTSEMTVYIIFFNVMSSIFTIKYINIIFVHLFYMWATKSSTMHFKKVTYLIMTYSSSSEKWRGDTNFFCIIYNAKRKHQIKMGCIAVVILCAHCCELHFFPIWLKISYKDEGILGFIIDKLKGIHHNTKLPT